MNIRQSFAMSWRSIRDHKLRSVLTTLGIIIGVGSVITFVTLGASLQAAVVGQVTAEDNPSIVATVGPPSSNNGPGGPQSQGSSLPVFTEHDIERLEGLSNVDSVVPQGSVQVSSLAHDGQTIGWESVTATTPDSFAADSFESGRAFTTGKEEVVLNEPAATLFSTNVSTGDTLTLQFNDGPRNVTVVGILNASSSTGAFGTSQPHIYVPTDPFYGTTVKSPATGAQQRAYPQVTVRAVDYDHVDSVQPVVKSYLANDSDANQLKPASYEVSLQTNQQLVDQIQEVIGTFTSFITGIAVISLIVGAIGIANIMLVSVTERTREIGIMKAIGGQKRDIIQLFIVEAVILGVIGSVVGTVVGIAGGYAAAQAIGFDLAFAPKWFAIAIVVGIGVGLVSGLYPAWNAARIDPIDALRHE
jgi:putative ABC transport system permease protein